MPLRRREQNCGPPTVLLHKTTQGEKFISNISKQDNWSVNKSDLVKKDTKHFIQLTKSIDFEKL